MRAWLQIFFALRSPKRLYFEENTLKDTPEAPTLECWRLNTLKGTKNSFVTPKRYHKHPPPLVGWGAVEADVYFEFTRPRGDQFSTHHP